MGWGFGRKRFRSPLVKIALFILRWILFGVQFYFALLMSMSTPFFGIPLLVSSVFWIIPETVTPIAEFVGDCWGSIFFPNARDQKPPLSYLLVDFYCKHGRHEEAIEESLKIIRHYPDEQRAYLDVIALCKTIGATTMAAKYERRFRKRFNAAKR